MSKENNKRSVKNWKSLQKEMSVNLLAIGGIMSLDCVIIMVSANSKLSADSTNTLAQQLLLYAIFAYVTLFVLGFFCFKDIGMRRKEKAKKKLFWMIAITGFNMITFILGGNLSSIVLIIPIVMMVYLREKINREV